ncbi:MAG: S1 RNA-binding domain-containing protein, partial [Flavobacteriales bacterium]
TNFGLFLELEEGVDGLIHISDLSWTKKIKHPSDFCKINDEMEVKVLEVDVNNRRLSLGHKQTTDNPWEAYSTIFGEGSVHEGKVSEVLDKGCNVLFEEEGITAFCPTRHMSKEDGSKLEKGETAKFRVIEFNKDSHKIVLSHTNIFREEAQRTKVKNAAATKEGVSNTNSKVEKSTLGDLDALAALKDKLNEGK